MDRIAERAGVGVGTLYRNYPGKDALMKAILAARAAPLIASAREALTDTDPERGFVDFLHTLIAASGDFKAMADSLTSAGLDFEAAKEEVGGELMLAVGALFSRAQQAGVLRPDVEIGDLHMLLGGLSYSINGACDAQRISRCVDLVCDALRTTPPRGVATESIVSAGQRTEDPRPQM